MANHVIIGAGLGGLYTANRLINKGIRPENIILIEKRPENHYTRPGHLLPKIFDLVTTNTGIATPRSEAYHIKELERVMYAHLCQLNVKFINEVFVELQAQTESQAKAVITRKPDNSLSMHAADYVFDCSGKAAVVVHAVNVYQQAVHLPRAFKTSLLVNVNPIPYHLVAQVQVPRNELLKPFLPEKESNSVPFAIKDGSLQKNIELRERLIALGWLYETFPTFYSHSRLGSNKVCLYMETPPHLLVNQQPAWIKLLLDIYTGGLIKDYEELKPSRKYGEKPRIVGFKNEPYVLNKVIHVSDGLPMVIIGFDALKGFDYRLANGIHSGIECCEKMLNHLSIVDGSIQGVDVASIENDTFKYLNGSYKVILSNRYHVRQNSLGMACEYFSEVYERAARTVEGAKRQEYQATTLTLAHGAVNAQYTIMEQVKGKSVVRRLEDLNKCLGVLIRARDRVPAFEFRTHQNFNKKLRDVMELLQVKIMMLNIQEFLPDAYPRLRILFENILQNLQPFEGRFASHLMQRKARAILEKIPQEPVKNLSGP